MRRTAVSLLASFALLLAVAPTTAQTFPTDDPVLRAIWAEGMDNSQAYELAQVLSDSIGPRLYGSPQAEGANHWAVSKFQSWGIDARNEEYGTWRGWRRGITHVDLISPWVRTLEAMMLSWSPGTNGTVETELAVLPEFNNPADLQTWLPNARGKFVLISMPQATCRPDANWQEYATDESLEAMLQERGLAQDAWERSMEVVGGESAVVEGLESAGALGVFRFRWPGNWGHQNISTAPTQSIPAIGLGCEDYGLLYRLVSNNQGPVVRVHADAEALGDVPVFNTIAEIRGSELPDEYIVLSAHLDSWDGGTGATDNTTGSVIMMETVRILKTVFPNPKRTIIVGLWGGEERGLIGSRAFSEDHPEVVEGLQAVFNQDNGTGRVVRVSMQGLTGAAGIFGSWISQVPTEITQHIDLNIPGTPGGGGSDYASFVCHGAPAFSLSSLGWDYRYTWHTQRDTFDKIVFDEVKNNIVLTAMLTYLASEDPERVPRDKRVMPVDSNSGEQMMWPACRPARRAYEP